MLAVNTLVLVVILCQPLESFAQENKGKCPPTDIGFLLDYSTTISEKYFQWSKEVIKRLVRDFKVGVVGSRAGLITFSDNASLQMTIGAYPTASEFNSRVDKVELKGGRTLINKALELANSGLFGPPQYNQDNAPQIEKKVLFVLTDGSQSMIRNNETKKLEYPDLLHLTKPITQFGVRIIVVAVGLYPDYTFLYQIAEKTNVVDLRRETSITAVVKNAYDIACRPRQPLSFTKKCSYKIDLGFALDASGSIGRTTFEIVTNFTINVLKKLDLSKTETHAGVIVYSTFPKLLIKLNQIYDLNEFSQYLVEKARWPKRGVTKGWMNGMTRIDQALNKSRELFSEKNGDRPGVRNVLVFLTDGKQDPALKPGQSLEDFSKPLKDADVEIMAVGFSAAKESELEKIASSPENVKFNNGSAADALTKAVEQIVGKLCNFCQNKVNLGFVLDASKTTNTLFAKEKELVKSIVEGFVLEEMQSQATLITFSKEAKVNIKFTSGTRNFETDLRFVQNMNGRTNILKGLQQARKEFQLLPNKDVPKILTVITDGKQSEDLAPEWLVKREADNLRAEGFTIIAVAVGSYPKMNVIEFIAGSKDKIVTLRHNKQNTVEKAEEVVRKACPGKTLETSQKVRDQVDDMELLDEMEDTLMHPYIS